MGRYVDVRLWLFWEERWSDQAIPARVRPTASGKGPYAVVMRFQGKSDILSLHPTVEEAQAAVEELQHKKWFEGKHIRTGLKYYLGKLA